MKVCLLQIIFVTNVAAFDCQSLVGAAKLKGTRLRSASKDEQIEKFQVPSSRGSRAVENQNTNSDKPSGWNGLKNVIYTAFDSLGSLSEELASGSGESGVEGGYASIERTVLNQRSNISPGQRLMNEYKSRSEPTPLQAPTTQSKSSAFDAFKEIVYGGVDGASQIFSNYIIEDQGSFESFKPLVQSTLSSSEIQGALPDLLSKNLIARKLAASKISNWDQKERRRQRALGREEAATQVKESIYKFGDSVIASAETLTTVPEQVSKAADKTQVIAKKAKKTVSEIPERVDELVTSITSIPEQVKATTDQLQDSVKISVENTKQVIDEVKSMPSRIENTVKDTQEKATAVTAAVDEATTSVKVLVGFEKPVPKPPRQPPPPPPTAGDVGMKIAGSLVSGAVTGSAKLALWAGRRVAIGAWNGAQSVYNEAAEKGNPQSVSPARKTNMKEVDAEVQEALDLAQSALQFADQGSPQKQGTKRKDNKCQ